MKVGKVKYNTICNDGFTMKPNFHLNFGKFRLFNYVNKGGNYSTLAKEVSNIHRPGIFKRMFVEKADFGYKYITASNMMEQDSLSSAKNISKKYTPWVDAMTLRDTEILVSCAGTVGNVRLITKELENVIGSQDIIRVVPFKHNYGYIYAYLASSTCYNYLQSLIYGSVVPRLDPKDLEKISIPLLPEKQQEEIHQLIVDAAQLRVEANKLLGKAVEKIKNDLPQSPTKVKIQTGKSNIRNIINNYQKRLDSPTFINWGINILELFQNKTLDFFPLKSFKVKVSRPGIFKRIKVNGENGLPYIKGSELSLINPFSNCEYLSKTKTPFLSELKLVEDQILLTCAGTVGDVTLITKEFEEKKAVGSQDIIRIESYDPLITSHYLFAYLKIDFVKDYIQSMKYGSVIERVEPFHIEMIPIFRPSQELAKAVSALIIAYKNCLYNAYQKETQAIQLIENEISTWQVS